MKNTFVKVLSLLMALMMFVGVFGMISVSAACAHEDCTETVVPATCEDAGFTKVVCNDCGEESIKDIVPATGKHTWTTVPGTAADCDEPAYEPYQKCTACGKKVGEKTPVEDSEPTGHYYNIPVTQVATCDQEGFTSKKCAVCGDVDKTPVDKGGNYKKTADKGHDLVYTVVIPATACLNGTYKVTCKNCDYTYEINDTDKKHTPSGKLTSGTYEIAGEGYVVVGTGCGAKYSELEYCTECKTKIAAKVNEDLGHTLSEPWGQDPDYTLTSTDINQKLINDTGLNMGSHTYVAATLNQDGYVLSYCSVCNTYVKNPIEKTINHANGEHTWNEGFDYTLPADHTGNTIRIDKCIFCGLTRDVNLNDAKPHNYTLEDGKPSQTVVPMSCTSNGYTRHICTICGDYYDDTIVYATGHDWTEWTFASKATAANDEGCTSTADTAMVRTCKNENCSKLFNDTWGKTTQKSNKTKHTFEVVTTPATCQANAFSENVCKDCGFNAGTTDVKQPAEGKDPTNHVVKDVDLGNTSVEFLKNADLYVAEGSIDKFLDVVKNQSCTDDQVAYWACACGIKVEIVVNKATGHTIVEGQKKTFGSGSSAFTRDFRDLPSDCNTQGQTAGKFCSVCGAIEKAPEKKPLDKKVHDSAAIASKVGDTIPANCVSVAIDRIYWSCCGEIIPTDAGTEKNPLNHPNAVKTNEVAATCLATGMQAYYYCPDCKVFMTANSTTYNATSAKATLAELNIVIPMLSDPALEGNAGQTKGQHNWNKVTPETAYKAEQCTKAGQKEYQTCKDCAAILVDGVVVFDNAATENVNEQTVAITIPAHGSAYITNMSYKNGKPNCNEGAYMNIPNALVCEKCGSNGSDDKSFHQEYWVDKTAHAPVTVYAQTTANDCTKATFVVKHCTICNAEWAETYNSASVKAEHKFTNDKGEYLNPVGETVAPTCVTPGYSEYKCDNCAETIKVIEKAALGHHHVVNGVKMPLSFSCVDYEANKGLTCVDGCGKTVMLDDPETKDVNENTVEHNHVTSKKDATCTEDGYYVEYCADCDKVFVATTETKKGHSDKSVYIETVDGLEKYNCPVCGEYWTKTVAPKLNVTVTASADKVAAGETFTVTYAISGAAYTFSALDLQANVPAGTTLVGITSNVDGLYAVVAANGGISLVVANNAAGEAQKVTTDAAGTVLFTLTYAVNKTASTGDVTITIEDDAEKLADAADTVKVTAAGNLNGDTVVTAEDAQAIFAKIGTNDVASDVNCDGIVNLADVIALAKFAASAKTAADYLEMVGELDTLEAEVFALLESGKLNDVNNDKIVNITDAYALIARVNTAIATGYTNLGNMVTMEAVVAYLNVNASLVIA